MMPASHRDNPVAPPSTPDAQHGPASVPVPCGAIGPRREWTSGAGRVAAPPCPRAPGRLPRPGPGGAADAPGALDRRLDLPALGRASAPAARTLDRAAHRGHPRRAGLLGSALRAAFRRQSGRVALLHAPGRLRRCARLLWPLPRTGGYPLAGDRRRTRRRLCAAHLYPLAHLHVRRALPGARERNGIRPGAGGSP